VEAKTYRVVPHSSDDDDRSYRTRAEVEQWKQRDPIVHFRGTLEAAGLLTPAQHAELDARAIAEVEDAVKFAQAAPYPDIAHAAEGVYTPPEAD
jgi:2-oxoisovalerate dehydrogenase E1 component alpha subunit